MMLRGLLAITGVMAAACGATPEPKGKPADPTNAALASATTTVAKAGLRYPPAKFESQKWRDRAGASDPADSPEGPPAIAQRRLRVRRSSGASSLNGPWRAAPCDFQRLYRGSFGDAPPPANLFVSTMSVLLDKDASGRLSGSIRYDTDAAPIAIERGQLQPDGSFKLSEKGGGTFSGNCANGAISGQYERAGKTRPFDWFARPSSWPALYQVNREHKVKECAVSSSEIRLFGGSAALRTAVNRSLDSGRFEMNVQEIGACTRYLSHDSHSQVLFAGNDVLTFTTAHSSDYGGAHPIHSAGNGGISIDLLSGRQIALSEVLVSTDRLLVLLPSCLLAYEAASEVDDGDEKVVAASTDESSVKCGSYPYENYLWGCGPDTRSDPVWAIVEGGIAILASGHAHVEMFRDGRGPIFSWAALAREKLLIPHSPVKRLWRGAMAAADAPACTSGFMGSDLVHWRPAGD